MIIDIPAGYSIHLAAQKACDKAKEVGAEVTFVFNDIEIYTKPQSFADDIAFIYFLKCRIRQLENQ